jgi:hypothetical protein
MAYGVRRTSARQLALVMLGAIMVGVAAFVVGLQIYVHPEDQKPGRFPEQLVFVRSVDDVVSGGVLFIRPKQLSKPLATAGTSGK